MKRGDVIQYPFSAIVGQAQVKAALILNAVDPTIGGVLIRGHKGTGKSTVARALSQLLPEIEVVEGCPFNSDPAAPVVLEAIETDGAPAEMEIRTALRLMPFIELPLNATEDRLVGTLHIEDALRTGKRTFEPGLLAAANRGILYVDEVNLLDDHLVDLLLDAAASGVSTVEREGISFVHPARFLLIGTMNPEEGELRPQFLDRFGLCVAVETINDPALRELIVRRHLAFEACPERFREEWHTVERITCEQILRARERLERVEIPDDLVSLTIRLTCDLKVQGHRADVTIVKAARAHAAFLERSCVHNDDIAAASRLAVLHRMKSAVPGSVEDLNRKLNLVLEDVLDRPAEGREDSSVDPPPEDLAERIQVPGAMAAGSILLTFLENKHREVVHDADPTIRAPDLDVENLLAAGTRPQRKSRPKIIGRTGRYRRSRPVTPRDQGFSVAVDATLRHAAARHARKGGWSGVGAAVGTEDLHKKEFVRPCKTLITFVVDVSESMGSGAKIRIRAAKGAVLALLRKAYVNRSEVALVAFGGDHATVVLPPTSSVEVAKSALASLPTGGATPFADGLLRAWQLVRSAQSRSPGLRPVLVIISDGQANVPVAEGTPVMEELSSLAGQIGDDGIAAVFIDAAPPAGKKSDMRHIAERMRASYIIMDDLTSSAILREIHAANLAPEIDK